MDRSSGPIGLLAGAGEGGVIRQALQTVRAHLGMEIAYFSEFVDGRSVFREVDAPGFEDKIKPGDSMALDDVYCNHILEGRLPELIPDTSAEPLAVSMPITAAAPIGSHASVPVRRPDGSVYGMFCCLSPRANATLNTRDLETMRVFAGLATRQLHADMEGSRLSRERRLSIETIISTEAYSIVYQPILKLDTMETVSYEALCRFSPEPYRSPDLWFADAAAAGLGSDLELAVIRSALAVLPQLPDAVSLSVNASPQTVLDPRLHEALDIARLDRTVIEITEHAQFADYRLLREALTPLVAKGLRIAIDDAGAGYSGLQHIVQMAPDIIKMDISLTRGIDVDRARRALASAMVYYARETGARIVAEGIETGGELETLRSLGICRGQGYLLGRPGPLRAEASREELRPRRRRPRKLAAAGA